MELTPLQPTPVGAFRFNSDSSKLEYYDGNQWVTVSSRSHDADTGGGRGVFGGHIPASNVIEYIQINTTGNSLNFGDLTNQRYEIEAVSDSSRGVFCGGYESPARVNKMEYVAIATEGNAVDFGDLSAARGHMAGASNSTRGIVAGGQIEPTGHTNAITHITIQSKGNDSDFGDLIAAAWFAGNGRSNQTRALFAGGASPSENNRIEYITIHTKGNSGDFGDTLTKSYGSGSGNASNSVRAVFAGGTDSPDPTTDVIQYNTFATLGTSVDFGNLSVARRGGGSVSDCIRGVFAGGRTPSNVDTIDFVKVMTLGDAIDFGNLLGDSAFNKSGCSNSHGGL